MPKIIVTKGFRVRFKPGQEMSSFPPGEHTLTADEMKNWFVQGCIEEGRAQLAPVKTSTKATPVAQTKAEGTLLARMQAVFPSLSEGDMKKDGTPKVQAVETALGENVTAAEVSAAWAEYQAKQGGA